MTIQELQAAILGGEFDDYFGSIRVAIEGRKDVLTRQKFHQLQPGDRVKVVSSNTGYLIGATATLKEKRVTKVTIVFDDDINDPYNKWAGKGCILSPSMIEKIED